MMGAPNNPPAFPRDYMYGGQQGMTLRDWFAGQALVGWIKHLDTDRPASEWIKPHTIAAACYMQADVMLAERERGQ